MGVFGENVSKRDNFQYICKAFESRIPPIITVRQQRPRAREIQRPQSLTGRLVADRGGLLLLHVHVHLTVVEIVDRHRRRRRRRTRARRRFRHHALQRRPFLVVMNGRVQRQRVMVVLSRHLRVRVLGRMAHVRRRATGHSGLCEQRRTQKKKNEMD